MTIIGVSPDHKLSEDGRRAVSVQLFGIACFEVRPQGDKQIGYRKGFVGSDEDAAKWLAGSDVTLDLTSDAEGFHPVGRWA